MNNYEETTVLENATAIRMRASELCGNGMTLEKAKAEALAKYSLKAVPEYLRPLIVALVNAMDHSDLYPADSRKVDERLFRFAVEQGMATDTRWGRFKYWLGITP